MSRCRPIAPPPSHRPWRLTLKPGEAFTPVTGDIHTVKLGIVDILRPVTFSGYEGPEFHAKPGDKFYLLFFNGEGGGAMSGTRATTSKTSHLSGTP